MSDGDVSLQFTLEIGDETPPAATTPPGPGSTPLPHLDWPYRLGGTVNQDTPQEHRAAAAVLACTERGRVDGLPTFGVTTPLFGAQPVDAELMARQINQYDPRLEATGALLLDLANPQVAPIQLDVGGES